jgi:DNA-binding GntR family transcriptional regulator
MSMEGENDLGSIGPLARNSLRHDIVVRLLESVFRGDVPAGTRLVIRKLATQFGISATPIREALVELEAIGIVQFAHNRGAVVRPFGRQQLREIFHLRRILEAEAALCACGRIPPEDLASLRHDMKQLLDLGGDESPQWLQRAMATDRRLHELMAAHCGDARLADEISRYNTLIQTIRDLIGNRRHAQQRALSDHMLIVDALLAVDAEKAAAATARHVDLSLKAVESLMFQET